MAGGSAGSYPFSHIERQMKHRKLYKKLSIRIALDVRSCEALFHRKTKHFRNIVAYLIFIIFSLLPLTRLMLKLIAEFHQELFYFILLNIENNMRHN